MWKVKVVSKLHNWVKFHMGQIAQNDYFVEQHADDVTHSMEDAFWFLEKYQIFVHSCTQSEDKDIAKRMGESKNGLAFMSGSIGSRGSGVG